MAIQQKAGFSLLSFNLDQSLEQCEVPVFFLHGKDDTFITPEHSQKNLAKYAGPKKQLELCAGTHNDPRPGYVVDKAMAFIKENI